MGNLPQNTIRVRVHRAIIYGRGIMDSPFNCNTIGIQFTAKLSCLH